MATPVETYVSVEDYLEMEYHSRMVRHEYRDGEIRMMGYASEAHELLIANLVALLHNCLQGTDCRVYPSNRLLHVPGCGKGFFYADVLVVCGPTQFFDYKKKMQATLNPSVIIEVQSDSTEEYDRTKKWECYQQIASLRQYVLVSQDEIHLETYRREAETEPWIYSSANGSGQSALVGECELLLENVYQNVPLGT